MFDIAGGGGVARSKYRLGIFSVVETRARESLPGRIRFASCTWRFLESADTACKQLHRREDADVGVDAPYR